METKASSSDASMTLRRGKCHGAKILEILILIFYLCGPYFCQTVRCTYNTCTGQLYIARNSCCQTWFVV